MDHKIMDEEIRDTSDHESDASDCRNATQVTILYKNSLNQSVSIQLQGSRTEDFAVPYDLGSPTVVTAASVDYDTLSDFWPFVRIVATCGTGPTTGKLESWVEKQKG